MTRKLRIMIVCGFGLGSSTLLRLKVEEVLKANDVKATAFTASTMTAKSENFDMILSSEEHASKFNDLDKPLVVILNFLDKEEIAEKALPVIANILEGDD